MTQKFPTVGDVFEQRYELLEVLGSGGVGTVFKARQTESGRLIALKVLHPHKVIDEEFKQRFLREAQALNKLSHLNIVTVYHLGLSEGTLPYLAMELINGVSLRKALDDAGRLPANRVFKIMKQLCSALSCMHESGIIHRDLKPANIMLMQKPEPDAVKIIDFGLVKVDAGSDQKLTATGLLIGSVNYMCPEQCMGKKADARSDIYALAICMYEMLAGEPPFTSDNPVGLMYKHVNQQPPELRLRTGKLIHPAVREFIFKGLEKDSALRFQTSAEMDDALSKLAEHFEGEIPSGVASSGALARQPLSIVFMLVCLFVTAGLVMWKHNESHTQVQDHAKLDAFNTALLEGQWKNDKFEQAYKRSLALSEKHYGSDSPEVLKNLQALIDLYKEQGKWVQAEPLLRRSLAIREKTLGPDHQDVSSSLCDLAGCYSRQDKYAEAETLLKRSLAIGEKAVGPDHPEVALSLNNLAELNYKQGNYAEAEPLYKRSLQIREKVLGSNHQEVAYSLNNLAELYRAQGKYAESEPLYKRSLQIRETVLGPNHPDVATVANNLAELYKQEGKYAESEPLYKRSLQIRETALGPDHPDVAQSLINYADLLRKTNQTAEGAKLEARAKAIRDIKRRI